MAGGHRRLDRTRSGLCGGGGGEGNALSGVGIDIEPSERLPDGIADLVASEEELAAFAGVAFGEKAILSIKEAVYKAVHARDGIFLEFGDVRVCRHLCTATTKYGRVVGWRVTTAPRVLAVAWW